jgi:hypothetical protein
MMDLKIKNKMTWKTTLEQSLKVNTRIVMLILKFILNYDEYYFFYDVITYDVLKLYILIEYVTSISWVKECLLNLFFNPEDGSTRFFQNISIFPSDCLTLHPRGQYSL